MHHLGPHIKTLREGAKGSIWDVKRASPDHRWHGTRFPATEEEYKLTGISGDDLEETHTKTLADNIEFKLSRARSCRAAGPAPLVSNWEGDSGQPLAGV